MLGHQNISLRNVGPENCPGYGSKASCHHGIDFRLGHGGKEGSDEERRLSLTEENVGRSIHRLGSRGAN